MSRYIRSLIEVPFKYGNSIMLQQWIKHPGDLIKRGDIIAVVDTGYTIHEVPSPTDGRLVEHMVATNQEFRDHEPIASIQTY